MKYSNFALKPLYFLSFCLIYLTSCQEDQEIQEFNQQKFVQSLPSYELEQLSKSQFNQIEKVRCGLEDAIQSPIVMSTYDESGATSSDPMEGLYVDDSRANHITSGDYESYSFKVIDPSEEDGTALKNLVLEKNMEGTYDASLVTMEVAQDGSLYLDQKTPLDGGSTTTYNDPPCSDDIQCDCVPIAAGGSDPDPDPDVLIFIACGGDGDGDGEEDATIDSGEGSPGGGNEPPPSDDNGSSDGNDSGSSQSGSGSQSGDGSNDPGGYTGGGDNGNYQNWPDVNTNGGTQGSGDPAPCPGNNPELSNGDCGMVLAPVLDPSEGEIAALQLSSLLDLDQAEKAFLLDPAHKHIAEALNTLKTDLAPWSNDDKASYRNALRTLSGSQSIASLDLDGHKALNKIIGRALTDLPLRADPIDGGDLFGEMYDLLSDPDSENNLESGDWENISIRTLETYTIVRTEIGDRDWNDITRQSELDFTEAEQNTMERNTLFVATISSVKDLVMNALPQSEEEWQALFIVVKPLLIDLGISALPGGGLALDVNEITTEAASANPDYTVIAVAVAGIVAEFIPWTKVLKFAKRALNFIKDGFGLFKKVKSFFKSITNGVDRGFTIATPPGAEAVIIRGNPNAPNMGVDSDLLKASERRLEVAEDVGKTLFDPSMVKNLTTVDLTPHVPRSVARDNGLKVVFNNPEDIADVDRVIAGLDVANNGRISERLADQFYGQNGFEMVPQSVRAAPGPQGFDNLAIKRNALGDLEEVIINESKQLNSPSANFSMSQITGAGAPSRCNGCRQMDDNWIDDVLVRMSQSSNPATVQMAQELRTFMQFNDITKTVSGVDRVTGEFLIVKVN